MKSLDKILQVSSLVICLLILSSLAIVKHGELWGHEFRPSQAAHQTTESDTLRRLGNGEMVINTTSLAADIMGYGGKVPLEITVKDGVVENVRAMDNAETRDFFDKASALLDAWNGKTIEEAYALKVDAVSGATFSSKAIIGNMHKGLQYAKAQTDASAAAKTDGTMPHLSLKDIAGLLVALMAATLPLFIKNKLYRLCQQVLNVVVLGFWCGTAISYTSLLGYASHDMNIFVYAVPAIMTITAFVYPLFGKKSYYCAHVCPFGSLQEVAGKSVKRKIRMSSKTVKRLDIFRQWLWAALMLCIWSGVWSDWTDIEPFSAFVYQSASWTAIAIAAAFIMLSFVVARPYCRFVCPVGTLMKLSQTSK